MKPATQQAYTLTACTMLLSQLAAHRALVSGYRPLDDPAVLDVRLLLATAPTQSGCEPELRLLNQLGWQHAYKASGYSIAAQLPPSCSTDTWQSLGCLHSLTNLTLSGSLPNLPDAWAANGSFPALQLLSFSGDELAGSLPDSWTQSGSFPQLKFLDLSSTQVSGTLPAAWGSNMSFPSLLYLQLGSSRLIGSLPLEWGSPAAFPSLKLLEISDSPISGSLPGQWGSATGFQNLTQLFISDCNVTGQLLTALSASRCYLGSLGSKF